MVKTLIAAALGMMPLLAAPPVEPEIPLAQLVRIERRVGARLGVAVLDTGTGRRLGYRSAERFPLCSSFKVLLAGAVLQKVDRGEARLEARLPYGKADLLEYAPVTAARVAEGGLPLEALCAAAVEVSDNTAANLLLRTIGGPSAVTAFARSLGDPTTRLDRIEPALNEVPPGDLRDTTSPRAMVDGLNALLLGPTLSVASRARVEGWMVACTTGRERLRAGIPTSWTVGDKTGTWGKAGTTNDIAILRPPGRAPILVAAYLTESHASLADREAALAEVGRLVASAFKN